jgi:hypothetical protein
LQHARYNASYAVVIGPRVVHDTSLLVEARCKILGDIE